MANSSPTVAATILADLARARGWVCGATFYASYRPTFSQRISELNAEYARSVKLEGAQLIVSRPCHQEGHDHRGGIYEYCLREFVQPEQMRLSA